MVPICYYEEKQIEGKNSTYAQGKIKDFAHNTVYCVTASFSVLCCFWSEMKNKENHHGGFNNKVLNF